MYDQNRACDEGMSQSEYHFCLYDHPEHTHKHCLCHERIAKRTCANPECRKRFKPHCCAAIFCCYDCFLKSNLKIRWDSFVMTNENDIAKLKKRLSKKLYRRSEKGKAQRQREYEKYNPKRREQRRLEQENCPTSEKHHEKVSAKTVLPPSKSEPKQCRRPGCLKRIVLQTHIKVKHFCSEECRKTFRNIRNILKKAYKKTKCPCVLLTLAFLISL